MAKKKKAKNFERYIATCPKCKFVYSRSTPADPHIPYFCACTAGKNIKHQLRYSINPDGPGVLKSRPKPLPPTPSTASKEKPVKKKRTAAPKMDLPSDVKKLIKMLKSKPPKHEARQIRAALRAAGHKGGLKAPKKKGKKS